MQKTNFSRKIWCVTLISSTYEIDGQLLIYDLHVFGRALFLAVADFASHLRRHQKGFLLHNQVRLLWFPTVRFLGAWVRLVAETSPR